MEDYLGQVKTLSDQLTLVSSPIDDEDSVLIILNGLPDEYSAFKTTIRARAESISVDCLCSLLCSEVVHVESSAKHSSSAEVPFAYVSNRQNSSPFAKSDRGGYRGGYSRNFNRGGRFFKGNRNRSGRGRILSTPNSASASHSSGSPTSLLICQICGKANHTALDCWYRMDQSFQGSSSTMRGTSPKAYVASSSSDNNNANWYLDSRATSHLTNNLNNLSLYQPYEGEDHVTIGDGNQLVIHHIGTGQSHQETAVSRPSY
ncbi:hypothetical protein CsSME_00035781 [Camellia sinensis var. sinensis]